MVNDVIAPNTLAYVVKATHVQREIELWGNRFVAVLGVASVPFSGLGAYVLLCGPDSLQGAQLATSAFLIGMALAALAMMWRFAHSNATVTIKLLSEIASKIAITEEAYAPERKGASAE